MAGNEGSEKKRKTLSLKISSGVSAPRTSSGNRTVEVEIKRKRSGLAIRRETKHDALVGKLVIDTETQTSQDRKLTDEEFAARVRALQDAIKEDEFSKAQEEFDEPSTEETQDVAEGESEKVSESERVAEQPAAETEAVDDTPKKLKRPLPKKKDKFVLNTKPVVFKSSEYQKKPVAKDTPKNTRVDKSPAVSPVNNSSVDLSLQERSAAYRAKNKNTEERDTPKKLRIVVKDRNSERRQNNGKMSRAMLDRALNDDMDERSRSMASLRRARQKMRDASKPQEVSKVIREVEIPDVIAVGELANRMAVRSGDVVKYLMSIGTMATINQMIDGDTAEVVCTEFGHKPKRVSDADIEAELNNVVDAPEDLTPRAPIVAVMGHVDHGKTTLLDTLRKTSVAQREAGGITQHVAAYQVETRSGKRITFIDTPGHAAFSNIRARGAVITDIIVLVVAADDGIKEQTIEVINQAKAQNVPLVVAINKIDKPNVNIEKVKSELMSHEVVLESFGGDTLSAEISAKHGTNIDGLLEAILLQAEVLELKANEKRAPVGTVLESRVDKGKGVVASVIVQHGTLKKGDVFVAGGAFGKVRSMYDDKGGRLTAASPAMPIELVGFDTAPEPGDVLAVVESEQKAREIAEYRKISSRAKAVKSANKSFDQMLGDDGSIVKILNIIVKTDVYGSLEAVVASLEAVQHPEISINILEKGVGIVSESDVDFAKTTDAAIVAFNVNVSASAKDAAKLHGIKILNHNIIYHLTEEVKAIMGSMLSPIVEENYIGTADVRKIFVISRLGTIAGCYVSDGIIKRNDTKIKVMRDGKCLFEGKIRSMKHEKDEIKESRQSHECGILAEGYNDFLEGDRIECYEIVFKSRSVD